MIPWLLAAMVAWLAPKTEADRVRYAAIASDAAHVASDPAEPPLFKGDDARERTALVLLAIARFESHYRADVDDGRVRGDEGASVCIMQIMLPGDARIVLDGPLYRWGKPGEGWGKRELIEDRRKCLRSALHMARESMKLCGDLSLYTSGRCNPLEGAAKTRLNLARKWYEKNKPTSGSRDPS